MSDPKILERLKRVVRDARETSEERRMRRLCEALERVRPVGESDDCERVILV